MAFASFFKRNAKCKNCSHKFKLNKRRKCDLCSNFHLEYIYCGKCSIKVKNISFGFFNSKRYCLNCYISISITNISEGTQSCVIKTNGIFKIENRNRSSTYSSSKSLDLDSDVEEIQPLPSKFNVKSI